MRCLKVCQAALIGIALVSAALPCGAETTEPVDAGNGAPQAADDQSDQSRWQAKFQGTYIFQKKPSFPAAYTGQNSLVPDAERSYTVTLTAYLGLRPWRGGELFLVPELTQGLPFSGLTGLAGFNNGELTRASGTNPKLYRQKLYLRQTWNLGSGFEKVEADLEEFPKFVDRDRFVLTVGNFALLDIFDDNLYAKDPRSQFMNWSNMTYAAYDYAADARGFTWGLAGEWYQGDWAVRFARVAVPHDPNQLPLDFNLLQHYGDQLEVERAYTLAGQPGKLRVLGFRERARLASFQDALVYLEQHPGGNPQTIFFVRNGDKIKYGYGTAVEQALTANLGFYVRAMYADGKTETLAFTEADKSVAEGVSLRGAPWGRPSDTVGLSHMQNMLSRNRSNYLEAGGISFFIGDGALNYAAEHILEAYYSLGVVKGVTASFDYQHVWNPAYNRDRGPVDVFGFRLHAEY